MTDGKGPALGRGAWKAARFVLGMTLCAAGFMKVALSWEFTQAIANYRILPAVANQLLGVLLPWCEVGTGLLLLLGLWVRASSLISTVFFAGFAVAVSAALLRGLDIDCGCFGTAGGGRIGLKTLMVDLAGLGLSILVFARGVEGPQPASAGAPTGKAAAAARLGK